MTGDDDPNAPRAMTFYPDGAYVDGVKVPGLAEWIATGEYPDPGASAEGEPADATEEKP